MIQLLQQEWYYEKSWVKGRFFVEKGIASMTSSKEVEQIIMRELQKWWEDCLNG